MAGARHESGLEALRCDAVREWFAGAFPGGPTPAQRAAWPHINGGAHTLVIAPTGTGKTLAAFLATLDRLHAEHAAGTLAPGLRCVYVSPLRSLGYDIETNLRGPLDAIRAGLGLERSPVGVAVRTGDTDARSRRRMRDEPPHVLITTPESLALLLGQPAWNDTWKSVDQLIVDEVHALVPTKRGADLAVSLERLADRAARDPRRVGLSATCRPPEVVARFLVGADRTAEVVEAAGGVGPLELEVASLLRPGEAPHRGLTYRRLLRRLRGALDRNRTTVIFANTRAFAEKITHDLRAGQGAPRGERPGDPDAVPVAAHHSALDAARRREVEAALKAGALRAVVTSTSLELGVDIGTADLSALVGLPGSVARCLQRVGRSGHRRGAARRGLLLAATHAELAGAAVTARAARAGEIEPVRPVRAPLDVLCQQLLGMACAGECSADAAFALVRRASPFATLDRADFDACLDSLAGDLPAPPGAAEADDARAVRWTSPRLWRARGLFGVRNRRVMRWLWSNIGTISAEESMHVVADGRPLGTLEAAYAERLQAGDRIVLDGRSLEVRAIADGIVRVAAAAGDPSLPRWSSDRQSLSAELARALAGFRERAAALLLDDGPEALRGWLSEEYALDPPESALLEDLITAQVAASEVPPPGGVLIEEYPDADRLVYAFHVPLARSVCEALGRAVAARLGRRFGRDVSLAVADLGWSIRLGDGARLDAPEIPGLLDPADLEADILAGLDRGELVARRFRRVAETALMVLRRPEGRRTRVGGTQWVSRRLYPLVVAACPAHPLLREARREVLDDLLDARSARAWLESGPRVRFRTLDGPSPFAAAWIDPAGPEPLRFEPPVEALRRLHARLLTAEGRAS
jgi:ATP-dependent Lhr-like helicase